MLGLINRKCLKAMGLGGAIMCVAALAVALVVSMATAQALWLQLVVVGVGTYIAMASLLLIRQDQSTLEQVLESIDTIDQQQLSQTAESLVSGVPITLFHLATKDRRKSQGFDDTLAEIGYSASELSSRSQLLASNTLQQSQATGSIAAAVTQISHSIEQMTERMRSTHTSADQSYQQGERGRETIDGVREHMEEVARCVDQTHEQLQGLDERTTTVSAMLSVIRDMAEQTNLLALNAAIEAARAGEHGRGFAVVAEEVRALANRSYDSAKEISITIEQMQNQMVTVKDSMDSVMTRTELTRQGADGAQAVLAEIAKHTQSVSEMVLAMAEATSQQNDAARDISERVEEVAVAASENSKVAEQSSSIADHLYNLCLPKESQHV